MLVMTEEESRVSVPEAARRLGLRGSEVYRLIFEGELDAVPTLHEGVRVPVAALERWVARYREPPTV